MKIRTFFLNERGHFQFISVKVLNMKEISKSKQYPSLMSGSCHLDRASIVEIGVECQIFVIVIFFDCGRALHSGANSRYYEGALTQKTSFLVICTTLRSDFHVC